MSTSAGAPTVSHSLSSTEMPLEIRYTQLLLKHIQEIAKNAQENLTCALENIDALKKGYWDPLQLPSTSKTPESN